MDRWASIGSHYAFFLVQPWKGFEHLDQWGRDQYAWWWRKRRPKSLIAWILIKEGWEELEGYWFDRGFFWLACFIFARPDVSEVVCAHTETQSATRPRQARDKACLVYDHSLFFPRYHFIFRETVVTFWSGFIFSNWMRECENANR